MGIFFTLRRRASKRKEEHRHENQVCGMYFGENFIRNRLVTRNLTLIYGQKVNQLFFTFQQLFVYLRVERVLITLRINI